MLRGGVHKHNTETVRCFTYLLEVGDGMVIIKVGEEWKRVEERRSTLRCQATGTILLRDNYPSVMSADGGIMSKGRGESR